MDDKKFEEDEKHALEGLSNEPIPHKKVHSYSHQLRTNTGTHHKRYHQFRHHSFDIPTNIIENNNLGLMYEDSSDDEDFYPYSTYGTTGLSLGQVFDAGYGLITTDISEDDINKQQQQQPLPEFVGGGGGVGIFKVPTRASVHPSRPSCHELRPHPLRETKVGKFLRTIACTETQLWADLECGIRVWNFSDQYKPGMGIGERARRGDEDAAPFHESTSTSPTLCLMFDSGSRLIWSGHKDGKIRSWKMDNFDESPFKTKQAEDEVNGKFVSKSKKEKSQGSSFLQLSRNAIMGAAEAVRRVATKGAGAFAEDNRKTEALVLAADGMIWSGCSNGLLVHWDGNGNRLQDFHHHPCAV